MPMDGDPIPLQMNASGRAIVVLDDEERERLIRTMGDIINNAIKTIDREYQRAEDAEKPMHPMTEITPEDLRVKAETCGDTVVVRMLTEAADAIEQLRDTEARLRMALVHAASNSE